MKTILVVLVVVTNLMMLVMSASLLDYLSDGTNPAGRDTDAPGTSAEAKRNCLCNGPSCICCVDFNMSFIDLGGPGCVRMNYISPEDGIAINVSYGDNLLHSQTVRGPDPAPTCLNIFSRIAQMCARFSHLLPTDDGLRGCVVLEPMLLGTTQIKLPIGCFRMGPNGMEIAESNADVINEQIPGAGGNSAASVDAGPPTDDDDDGDDDGTPEGGNTLAFEILNAVSDSAELLTNWFGLAGAATTAPAATPANNNTTDAAATDESGADDAATTVEPSA